MLLFLIAGWILDGFSISAVAQKMHEYSGKTQPEPPTYGTNYINVGRTLGEIFVKQMYGCLNLIV